MVYVFGIGGFLLGFLIGLVVINVFLKHYSTRDLVKDKSLRWTYGLAVWVFAGLGSGLGVWLYERSFF
ncbi:MAG: hypothetical protein DI551_01770 [Micavibrio aeruginosavorus]|uniref:Uncharacterized protein n=1 Tax=Micavibrio aeruginosavorus TaxID=349221 RepID=A0A2W5N451_9BACT|nr:MAG: hypothetical protein DI551_01770 [Micavibrio aeruginosavorus]